MMIRSPEASRCSIFSFLGMRFYLGFVYIDDRGGLIPSMVIGGRQVASHVESF